MCLFGVMTKNILFYICEISTRINMTIELFKPQPCQEIKDLTHMLIRPKKKKTYIIKQG
jgi:hypothetical protein